MKNVFALLIAAALTAGCGVNPGRRSAHIQCVCPSGQPETYVVGFTSPTENWRISGHGLGLYRERRTYALRVSEWPRTNVRYSADEIALVETTGAAEVPVVLSGGLVEIDPNNRLFVVSLETPEGAFWANGRYPTNAF